MVCGKCPDKQADRKMQLDFDSKWLQKLYTQLTFDPENKQGGGHTLKCLSAQKWSTLIGMGLPGLQQKDAIIFVQIYP